MTYLRIETPQFDREGSHPVPLPAHTSRMGPVQHVSELEDHDGESARVTDDVDSVSYWTTGVSWPGGGG